MVTPLVFSTYLSPIRSLYGPLNPIQADLNLSGINRTWRVMGVPGLSKKVAFSHDLVLGCGALPSFLWIYLVRR
jgi:hypothetical protein